MLILVWNVSFLIIKLVGSNYDQREQFALGHLDAKKHKQYSTNFTLLFILCILLSYLSEYLEPYTLGT